MDWGLEVQGLGCRVPELRCKACASRRNWVPVLRFRAQDFGRGAGGSGFRAYAGQRKCVLAFRNATRGVRSGFGCRV